MKMDFYLKIGLGIFVLGFIILAIFLVVTDRNRPVVGESFPEQGREHVAGNSPLVEYNSNPPTSGPHFAKTVSQGVHDTEIDDRNVIHNLEHGEIWISYNCSAMKNAFQLVKSVYAHGEIEDEHPSTPSAEASPSPRVETEKCQELVSNLEKIVKESNTKKLVLSPRSKNDSLIAVASWTWLLKLDEFDETKIKQFISNHLNKGPEFIPE